MSLIQSSAFLRRVLLADAISCAAMGLMLLALASPVGSMLNLPAGLLIQAGVVLLPFAAFVAYLASRRVIGRMPVWIVIALNVVWIVDSFVLLALDSVEPNLFGTAFVIGQALFVAVITGLEYAGLQRSGSAIASQ